MAGEAETKQAPERELGSTESIGQQIASGKLPTQNVEEGSETCSAAAKVAELFAAQVEGLALVEDKVGASLGSDAELLTTISQYLQNLGGKRIRPLLALSSFALCRTDKSPDIKPDSPLIEATAGIELIHMATLLHDDIIDKSLFRRNSESAFSKFGLAPTLLAGDFLLVKAFGMCARLSNFVIENTERACIELTEGELLEGDLSEGRVVTLDEYRVVIEKKTASLFALSCCIGGHFAGSSDKDIELLRQFGNEAGVLFQMVDDILDVTATTDLLGKPSGIDLVQKTPTLPNILWLESGSKEAEKFFSQDDGDVKAAIASLKEDGIIERSMAEVEKCKIKTLGFLDKIESNKQESDRLKGLLDYTVSRIPSQS